MCMTKKNDSRGLVNRVRGGRNRKQESFRAVKAFGLWADRKDLKDPIRFHQSAASAHEAGSRCPTMRSLSKRRSW
jgi:hypothetical protein